MHIKYKVEPYNVRLYKRGYKLWEKFRREEPELAEISLEENNNNEIKDHYWWRRIAVIADQQEPLPVYTSTER